MIAFTSGSRAARIQSLVLVAIAVAAIVYLGPKAILTFDEGGLDFRVIWLAGKMWAAGQSPYGPSFVTETYPTFFGPGKTAPWFYPPYWYCLAVPLSYWSFPTANSIWKAINFFLLIEATHLIARALADTTRQRYLPIFCGGIAYACFMQATAVTIFIGQTSILVYFGLAAIIYGLLKHRQYPVVIGLVFVALKPQIGVVAFAAVLALHRIRWTVLAAGMICLLAIAPIAITADYRESIVGFLLNLSHQPGYPADTPTNLTGLINLLDLLFAHLTGLNWTLTVIALAIVCAGAVFYCSSLGENSNNKNAHRQIASLSLFLGTTFFLLPLHSYDLVSLAALIMIIMVMPVTDRWLIAGGLLICLRPINLAAALGLKNPASASFPESHLVSAGLLLILIGAAVAGVRAQFAIHRQAASKYVA